MSSSENTHPDTQPEHNHDPKPSEDETNRVEDEGKNNLFRVFLYLVCFVTGAVILSLEVLGFKLLAPYFGTSVYVSGTLISLILGALALGYLVGGWMADRYPNPQIVFSFIFISGLYVFAMYMSYPKILKACQELGVIKGTVSSTLIIFLFPMLLLSVVSPYLIKLLARENELGSIAGRIFCVSTIGSIIGSFGTTFFMIPELGSHQTLFACMFSLILIGLVGLSSKKLPVFILALGTLPFHREHLEPFIPGTVHLSESAYNLIHIVESDGLLSMRLNNPRWWQSYRPDVNKLFFSYREYFNLAPHIKKVHDVLILGMSAGASIHELNHLFDLKIDAVEIDPKVVELADKYFDIREGPDLKIFVDDARTFLNSSTKTYDFIEIDLFNGGPSVPSHVISREFFQEVANRTSEDGLIMMNLISGAKIKGSHVLVRAVCNTVSKAFPSVFTLELPKNTLVVATKQTTNLEDLVATLRYIEGPLKAHARGFTENVKVYQSKSEDLLFTDNRNLIEKLSFELIENPTKSS